MMSTDAPGPDEPEVEETEPEPGEPYADKDAHAATTAAGTTLTMAGLQRELVNERVARRVASGAAGIVGIASLVVSFASCGAVYQQTDSAEEASELAQARIRDEARVECAETFFRARHDIAELIYTIQVDPTTPADPLDIADLHEGMQVAGVYCLAAGIVQDDDREEFGQVMDAFLASANQPADEQLQAGGNLLLAAGIYMPVSIELLQEILETRRDPKLVLERQLEEPAEE